MMVGGKSMKNKNDCDCLLGFISDDKIYKSNLDWELERTASVQSKFYDMGLLKGKPLKPKDILDNRRGYIYRFTFCPHCGEKINWKDITNRYID
jgi:hypothetical protein